MPLKHPVRNFPMSDEINRASIGPGDHISSNLITLMLVETPVQAGNPVHMPRNDPNIMSDYQNGNFL